jgi:CxxC motif-containing protein (DUF1111 family)
MMTGSRNETEALENQQVHLYSDLLLHRMGSGLADNITQGLAQGDMFRTTPLWGISSRNQNNQGNQNQGNQGNGGYPPSEANAVIRKFMALSVADQQAILDFLGSL